jgi:hypothetical protein
VSAAQQLHTDRGAGLDIAASPMDCQNKFHCLSSPGRASSVPAGK